VAERTVSVDPNLPQVVSDGSSWGSAIVHHYFGVVRILDGKVDLTDDSPHYRRETTEYGAHWPPEELHNGVGYVSIKSNGDDPHSMFLEVEGFDRETTYKQWLRVALTAPVPRWWQVD
jgi:hypothetical protein